MIRILFLITFVAGCAAPGRVYLPPTATNAEISAAKTSSENVKLPDVPRRSEEEMLELYQEVQRSIYPAALSICRGIGELNSLKCTWSFELRQDATINAYASGENTITFNSALIENWVGYQEELAFVLAHEIAHHIANHINEGTNRISTGVLIGSVIGIAAAQRFGDEENELDILSAGSMYGGRIASLVYSVEAEQEADLIALEILKRSNINLQRARNVIVRMVRDSNGGNRSSFGDSHPTGIERLAAFDRFSTKPPSIKIDAPLDEKLGHTQDGYLKATFDKAIGSYCVYRANGKKFPVPLTSGCPPVRYFKE